MSDTNSLVGDRTFFGDHQNNLEDSFIIHKDKTLNSSSPENMYES